MTITKANFELLKRAALTAAPSLEVKKAIEETETANKAHNKKMSAYIMEKRKDNKNYCR